MLRYFDLRADSMRPSWVYILRCADGSYYTGCTTNLDQRITEHRRGVKCSYTKSRRPVEVVFTEQFSRIDDAIAAERQIKGWTRKKKEALIEGRVDDLKRFARSKEIKERRRKRGTE